MGSSFIAVKLGGLACFWLLILCVFLLLEYILLKCMYFKAYVWEIIIIVLFNCFKVKPFRRLGHPVRNAHCSPPRQISGLLNCFSSHWGSPSFLQGICGKEVWYLCQHLKSRLRSCRNCSVVLEEQRMESLLIDYCNNLPLGNELQYLVLSCLYGAWLKHFVSMLPLCLLRWVCLESLLWMLACFRAEGGAFSCSVFYRRNPRGGLTQKRNLRNVPTNVWCCCRAKTQTSLKRGNWSVTCHGKVTLPDSERHLSSRTVWLSSPLCLSPSSSFLLKITATLLWEA